MDKFWLKWDMSVVSLMSVVEVSWVKFEVKVGYVCSISEWGEPTSSYR